jgi:hypothetical protein
MLVENNVFLSTNPLGLDTKSSIRCDCSDFDCNQDQTDFPHRQLPAKKESPWKSRLAWRKSSNSPQAKQESARRERKGIVERSKV